MTLNGITHKKITGPIIISLCCIPDCGTFLGIKSSGGQPSTISHGYCPSCYNKEIQRIEEWNS